MTEIDYEVVRSEEATQPRIDVDIHHTKVVIPENSDLSPRDVIREKEDWVKEKQKKFKEQRSKAPDRNFEEGEEFLYLGEPRRLKFEDVSEVLVEDSTLKIPAAKQESADELLEEFFKEKAKEELTKRVEYHQDKLDVEFNDIAFRNQRTRWGSCSAKENLSFNWRMVMAPPEVIDYVVVHELVHLKERNHTKRFWSLVENHHDSYEECIEWLNENAPRMIFRREDL